MTDVHTTNSSLFDPPENIANIFLKDALALPYLVLQCCRIKILKLKEQKSRILSDAKAVFTLHNILFSLWSMVVYAFNLSSQEAVAERQVSSGQAWST